MQPSGERTRAVLAIDIGSSSVRATVFDDRASAVDGLTAQYAYELDAGRGGAVTLDLETLFTLVVRCIDDVLEQASDCEFQGVGISCFWHSLIGLDDRGVAITPVFHLADSRSADIVDWLRNTEDEAAWHSVSGTVFHSSYWPAKLLWLRDTDPATFSSVGLWTSAADALFTRLTGTQATSICMASGTGIFDISNCTWSEGLCKLAGVSADVLPEVIDRDTSSLLRSEFALRWPKLAGIPWFPPLGDGACANVGCNAVGRSRIALTLGTTGAMRVVLDSPVGHTIAPIDGLWTYRLDGAAIVRGAAITNGGIWADFLRDILADDDMTLLDEAFALPPAAHGLTVLPFLAGERSPIWNDRARAVIAGLSPRTTRASIARAGLEAIGHRFRLIYDLVRQVAEHDHQIVANGAALLRSDGWQQIVVSALGHPIVTLPDDLEASARGAAICTLQSCGLIDSIEEAGDLVAGARIVMPDPEESTLYDAERIRQERLRQLLYPQGGSWDQE